MSRAGFWARRRTALRRIFLTGWLNLLLIALVLLSLGYSMAAEIREKRRSRTEAGEAAA